MVKVREDCEEESAVGCLGHLASIVALSRQVGESFERGFFVICHEELEEGKFVSLSEKEEKFVSLKENSLKLCCLSSLYRALLNYVDKRHKNDLIRLD